MAPVKNLVDNLPEEYLHRLRRDKTIVTEKTRTDAGTFGSSKYQK